MRQLSNFVGVTAVAKFVNYGAALLLFATTAAAGEIAQSPLFLTANVKPNVMLMLDNSGSMGSDLVVNSSGTPYDPTISYLAGTNCANTPLPVAIEQSRVDDSLNSRSECEAVGGSWSRRRNRCTVVETVTVSYGTSIPGDFFGNRSGRSTGTRCFVPTLSYTTSLSIPAGVTTDAQRANYLNWYYSNELAKSGTTTTRMQVAKNAAVSLVDSLDDNVRLGLTFLDFSEGGELWEVVDDLTATKKNNIKDRINAVSPQTWTPLAETLADIGNYFATGSNQVVLHAGQSNASSVTTSSVLPSPLENQTNWSGRTSITGEPGFSSSPIQFSCQKNFAIFITDGLPTKDRNIDADLTDYDGDCSGGNSANCLNYDMKTVFGDPGNESSDYFDDVAQALFEMDLRPDLRNADESATAKNNLTTFVIGFADDALNPNIPGVNTLPRDAAVQGGGKFYYAGNESELNASLASAFSFIIEQASSSSSVATNSTKFQTDSLVYQAIFDSNEWTGDLRAFTLLTEDSNGNGVLDSGEDLNGNGKIDAGEIGPKLWFAAEKLPAPDLRNIYSFDPNGTTIKGVEFKWANLNASQQAILGSEAVVEYIRGKQDQELNNGGTFRNRTSVLGDIVSSDPLYVGRDNAGYANLPGAEGSTYDAFAATTRREMIYVDANDGMLHGFDAGQGIDGGKEIFAYVPNVAITSALVSLTDPNYAHRYLVDGSPQAGDVYYDSAWHTVLVGSLGGGGKSIFALDITDPDSFAESNVLWEFSEVDMGFALPEASVVRMANGQWAAVVANGYNSISGKAVLYVINIKTGALIKKIEAEAITGANGLSSPVVVDVDGDNIADYVYAGDLQGNLWKFDISSSDPANWALDFSGSPLFVARDAADPSAIQPITAKPAASKATAAGQNRGMMIYFGTGKFFEIGDNIVPASPQIQTFYGIWDDCDKSGAGCSGVISSRDALQQQTIIFEGSTGTTIVADGSTVSGDVRVTSKCEVGYGSNIPTTNAPPCTTNINRRGWYLDLLSPGGAQGERVVSTAVIRNGVVIFPTLIPITTACTPGGTSWLMELDQFSGARLAGGTPVDLNEDGVVDEKDMVRIDDSTAVFAASGFKSTVGIIDTPAIINCEEGLDCKYASGSSGEMMLKKEIAPPGGGNPGPAGAAPGRRRSWQQLH